MHYMKKSPILMILLIIISLVLAFGAGFMGARFIVSKADPGFYDEDSVILTDKDPLYTEELLEETAPASENDDEEQAGALPGETDSQHESTADFHQPESSQAESNYQDNSEAATEIPLDQDETPILP